MKIYANGDNDAGDKFHLNIWYKFSWGIAQVILQIC